MDKVIQDGIRIVMYDNVKKLMSSIQFTENGTIPFGHETYDSNPFIS